MWIINKRQQKWLKAKDKRISLIKYQIILALNKLIINKSNPIINQ